MLLLLLFHFLLKPRRDFSRILLLICTHLLCSLVTLLRNRERRAVLQNGTIWYSTVRNGTRLLLKVQYSMYTRRPQNKVKWSRVKKSIE